jgi:esterase/lipase superfamily enzyme
VIRSVLLALLVSLGCLAPVAQAQTSDGAWLMLTSAVVAPDAKSITLTLDRNAVRTTAVRFKSRPAILEPTQMAITYSNGQRHVEYRETSVPMQQQFDEIDNRRDARVVAKVDLTFKSTPPRTQSVTVEVWGQTAPLASAPKVAISAERPTPTAQPPQPRPAPAPLASAPGAYKAQPPSLPPAAGSSGGQDKAAASQPPAPAPVRSTPRSMVSASANKWLAVPVLYGTTRKADPVRQKNGVDLAAFGSEFNPQLTLGTAVVTVPIEREPGTIPRPPGIIFEFRREDPAKDFTIARVDQLTAAAFATELTKRAANGQKFGGQAFVFIHGFSVSFDDALFRTAQITHDMGFDGASVLYSWPSRGSVFSYLHDLDTAKLARDGLRQLLEMVAASTGVSKVNVVAHSLGNDPLIEVLKAYGREPIASRPDLKLREVVFASPDVSIPFFQQLASDVPSIPKLGMTLYASNRDRALRLSDKSRVGMVRAGDVPAAGPVIVAGVDSIDVSAADLGFFGLNHGAFADRRPMIEDLRTLFDRSLHPPEQRFPAYKRRGTTQAPWWSYFTE